MIALPVMSNYFFHLLGEFPAHDVHGHLCTSDSEAKQHASFLAHRLTNEMPQLANQGTFISVTNEKNQEVAQVPLVPSENP